jgi:hypothetical protein
MKVSNSGNALALHLLDGTDNYLVLQTSDWKVIEKGRAKSLCWSSNSDVLAVLDIVTRGIRQTCNFSQN